MGNSNATRKVVNFILSNWEIPLLLDADALNVLESPRRQLKNYRGPLIVTPHPGELARMTGCDPSDPRGCREAAAELAHSANCCVLLKGRPTMVFSSTGDHCMVPAGNSGMATGGSGDVLSGVVSSLMAQGLEPSRAGILGAFVHGLAGDMAVENSSKRALTASDIAAWMGPAFMAIEKGKGSKLLTSGGRWNSEWDDPARRSL